MKHETFTFTNASSLRVWYYTEDETSVVDMHFGVDHHRHDSWIMDKFDVKELIYRLQEIYEAMVP